MIEQIGLPKDISELVTAAANYGYNSNDPKSRTLLVEQIEQVKANHQADVAALREEIATLRRGYQASQGAYLVTASEPIGNVDSGSRQTFSGLGDNGDTVITYPPD